MKAQVMTCPHCQRTFELTTAERTSSTVEIAALDQRSDREARLHQQIEEMDREKKAFELELTRRIIETAERVAREKDDEHRLKEAESLKKHADLAKQIDELKRTASQNPPRLQGEVLELDLETSLRRSFPRDSIEPVPVGSLGGDILQRVRDDSGAESATIIFEVKSTRTWNEGWLTKLLSDQSESRADVAVLVTTSLPKGVTHFEQRQGIWIVAPALAIALVLALRSGLLEVASAKRAADGRGDKIAPLYTFLASTEFKTKIGLALETFRSMKSDLDSERNSLRRIWSKREKQLERLMTTTVEMHGTIAGIIEQSGPAPDVFQLDSNSLIRHYEDDGFDIPPID